MQSHFATDGYEKLGGVQRYFAEGVREDYAAGGLDAQVSGAFSLLHICCSTLALAGRVGVEGCV